MFNRLIILITQTVKYYLQKLLKHLMPSLSRKSCGCLSIILSKTLGSDNKVLLLRMVLDFLNIIATNPSLNSTFLKDQWIYILKILNMQFTKFKITHLKILNRL